MAEGRKNAFRKRLLKKRRSAAYARKLFSEMGKASVYAGRQADKTGSLAEETESISEETGEQVLGAGEEAAREGASLISRFYQKAGIKKEYEAVRSGKAVNGAAGAFTSGFRPAAGMVSRIRRAFDGEQIAGRFRVAITQKGPYLLFFAPVLLAILVLVGSLAAVPLVLEGGTTIALQSGNQYEVPREYLSDERFARMIEEGEKYLGYPYVWGGGNPLTGFDCSGFVSWVINHSGNGWNYGRLTANGLLSVCVQVPRKEAKPGDLIFFQKTYDTYGASHLGIYVGDNMMLHCGDPIGYTRIDTEYWKEHYLCYGRLPDP